MTIELNVILKRATAIRKSKIEYVELNANPILGCSHACRYCYARKLDIRFGRVKNVADWHRPKAYQNFFEVLEKEIKNGKIPKDKEIFMSTMTDLYQPYAVKEGIAKRLIEMIQEAGLKYRILTKSPEVVKDAQLHSGYKYGKVGLSITTDSRNDMTRKYWEPRTATISERLMALRQMDRMGNINLWVSAEPFLPGTDFSRYFSEIIGAGGDSLKEIIIGKMNYETGIDDKFDWENVVRTCEEYRQKNIGKIRFHYKKEFWNYITRHEWNPIQLGIAKKDEFCY